MGVLASARRQGEGRQLARDPAPARPRESRHGLTLTYLGCNLPNEDLGPILGRRHGCRGMQSRLHECERGALLQAKFLGVWSELTAYKGHENSYDFARSSA